MKKQLLIVTDRGSFKVYTVDNSRLHRTARLELVEQFNVEEPHRKMTDKLSDLAGRYRAPGVKGGMPFGERHNIQLEERKRLVRQLSRRLNVLMSDREVDSCYLAASKEIDHQILGALSPAAQAKIKKNLSADLLKASKEKLLDYFGLRPEEQRAAGGSSVNGGSRSFRAAV
jgi:hypothetical protein